MLYNLLVFLRSASINVLMCERFLASALDLCSVQDLEGASFKHGFINLCIKPTVVTIQEGKYQANKWNPCMQRSNDNPKIDEMTGG